MTADATGMVAGHQALDALATKGAKAEATVTKAMREVGQSGQVASQGLQAADGAAQRTAASMGQAAQQARQAGQEVNNASGYTANLAANFNDIAVMMAAGQNPIQLALQQGTQISQVLVQMGGGVGAVKAIGGAFMAMLSPVSLATLGIIAFGAAASQWLFSTGDGAKSLGDRMDDLTSTFDAYKASADMANVATGEAAAKFGMAATQAARYQQVIADINRMSLDQQFKSTGGAMLDTIGANMDDRANDIGNVAGASKFFGLGDNVMFGDRAKELRAELIPLIASLQDFRDATDLDDRIEALGLALERSAELAKMDGKISQGESGEQALLDTMRQTLDTLHLLRGEEEEAGRSRLDRAQEYAGAIRQQWAERAKFVEDETEKLNLQAEVQQLSLLYGANSVEVTQARVQAERDAYAEVVATKVGANDLADSLMDAWDNAHGVASVDASGNIVLAADATDTWADAMARVNAQLAGAMSLLASIGGGMVQRAGINAANAVLDAGGTSIAAEKARRRAEERTRMTNEANTAAGFMSPDMLDANLAEMERQWAIQDEYEARLTGVREGERAAARASRKKGGKGKKPAKDRMDGYERSVADIQSETQAFLRQADAIAQVTAAGGDWERALAVIEEEQKLLNAAQKAGVELTPQVRAGITEMAEAYVDAEEKLDRMREATEKGRDTMEGFFGSIVDGSEGVIDSLKGILEQIAKVQLAKAGMGLLGATSWGNSMMTSLGSLLSMDGGGYTGGGSRSGGMDGKGGFLAMLHPQETVIDHTKGQSLGGSVDVRVFMDDDGTWQAQVERISGAVSARTVAQDRRKQANQQYLKGGR